MDASIDDGVVRGRENIRKEQCLFIRNFVRNREKVHVALRYAHVLGLAAREPASEMRIAKST
jgi:hypothetical protein